MHNSKIISKVKVTKALTLGSCLWKFEVLKSTFYNSKVIGAFFSFKFGRLLNKINTNSKKNYIRKKTSVYVNCNNGIYMYSKPIFLQDNNYVSLLHYQPLDTFLHQNKPQKLHVSWVRLLDVLLWVK